MVHRFNQELFQHLCVELCLELLSRKLGLQLSLLGGAKKSASALNCEFNDLGGGLANVVHNNDKDGVPLQLECECLVLGQGLGRQQSATLGSLQIVGLEHQVVHGVVGGLPRVHVQSDLVVDVTFAGISGNDAAVRSLVQLE